jgi:3-mercaptopyruvate sulfurtransferase SseA
MLLLGHGACAESSDYGWIQDKFNNLVDKFTSSDDNDFNSNGIIVPASRLKSTDLILDVGSDPEKYIYGAVHVPFTGSWVNVTENHRENRMHRIHFGIKHPLSHLLALFSSSRTRLFTAFMENNSIKPLPAIAAIIGDAGISRNDSVALYGKCLPCGGGPSTATFVYWIMRYAGHENVKLIDGGYEEWVRAGGQTQSVPSLRNKTAFVLHPRSELLANFSYVARGGAQLVDARSSKDFFLGTIPGSMNIPYDNVIEGDKIKNESSLKSIFREVNKNKPVVVYTATGVKASVVWFALTLMGYDAKLYTFQDWYYNKGPIYLPVRQYVIETEI